jgi:dethiobiotin synthetase
MGNKGFFITGTDTGVGKTLITAQIGKTIQNKNVSLGAMKPIETGVSSSLVPTTLSDMGLLKTALGISDPMEDISPYRYQTPTSPLVASKLENKPINPQIIIEAYQKLTNRYSVMLAEGAGGLLVPINRDYLMADLAKELGLPIIIVTRFHLGTINQTALTIEAAQTRGLKIEGIIFNCLEKGQPTDLEKFAPEILEEIYNVPVIAICPFLGDNPKTKFTQKDWRNSNEASFSYFSDWARQLPK